ncbi:uncharacterized protein LOC130134764 [Syzygium oleosum]|uniref:uncharacterized protein LOC130134764 n=1 Tax=Syzygium oleosum TaxID=219896 RepID=UPI0024BA5141|nr:uncharacterized protein LOC130134764 [Syzygium oleosum]
MALTDSQKAELEVRKLKDLKAKNDLFQAIDRSILETILCKETFKDIWDSMKKKYQGSVRVKRAQIQALKRDFETLGMKDGESVTSYFARTMEISNKMRFHGEKMDDVTIVEKILHFLTPKFNYVVSSIEELKDIDALSLDKLQSSLLVHEQKINSKVEEQALKASTNTHSNNFRGRGRDRGGGKGDRGNRDVSGNFKANNDQSQGKGRGWDLDKSKVECFRCHKFGHYASECYIRLPNDKEKEENSNFVEKKETETLLMAVQDEKKPKLDIWYVDTGCSNHISGSKSSFSYLNEDFHSAVNFGDHSTVKVMGKCNIKIKTKNGFVETISTVIYVPDLKSNLLSTGQLQENNYVITIKKGACEIYDSVRDAIAIVQMSSNRLFPLKIESIQSCLTAEMKDPS